MEIRMYTVEQAAEILGARPSTIRTYCREGRIPAMKVGRGYRIVKEDLERWLKKQQKNAGYQEEEQRIAEAEARYKDLFENASDGIIFFNISGRLTLANPRACEFFGYTLEEAEGMHFARFIHPEDLPVVAERFMSRMAGEDVPSRYEVRCLRKGGQVIPIEISSSVVTKEGKPSGAQIILRDMSERKKAEEALKESEEKFRTLAENTKELVYIADPETFVASYVNPAISNITGYTAEEWLSNPKLLEEATYPEDKERYFSEVSRAKKKKEDITVECRIIRKDKKVRWIEDHVHWIKDDKGKIVSLQGVISDITERKKAEEELKASEAKYKELVEGLGEALYRMSLPDGKYEYFSPAAKAVFGYSAEDFLDKPFFIKEIIHPDFANYFKEKCADFREGKVAGICEYRIIDPEGKERWIRQSNKGLFDNNGNIIAVEGICRNITEHKKAEEVLTESEERYRSLFEDSPISIWKEDFSQIKKYLDGLRRKGITDFKTYFKDHPEEVAGCVAMVRINDINRATLELYGAASKKELLESLSSVFSRESYEGFKEELVAITEGKTRFELETVTQTLKGKKKDISLRWSVVPGYEETMAKVIVSIIDMTGRKKEMKIS